MNFAGLSTDQAPPISAPLRFFLTAPLFGILAGILILFGDTQTLMSRYSIESIVVTHLITIGFFSFVMFGALTQMLPVLVGAKMLKVKSVTTVAHIAMSIGMLSMVGGLLLQNQLLNGVAFTMLGAGFLLMILSVIYAIKGVEHITATLRGMKRSVYFALLIVFMGLFLLYDYVTMEHSSLHFAIANIHSVLAVFGFAGILIIGVAFQVLPMFYVAPKFKNFCKKYVVNLISIGLLLWFVLNLYFEQYALVGKFWIALFFWAFATTVWIKLNRRKRPVSDVTVWYWRAASIFLTLGSFLWIFDEFFKTEYIVMVAVLIGGGFILSILVGMLYKIVPFLVWFHLNALGYMSIPTITEMIDKRMAKIQFFLFVGALVGFIFSFYMEPFLLPSAVSFIVSMALLEYNILAPVLLYVKTKKTKPDFDMSAFAV